MMGDSEPQDDDEARRMAGALGVAQRRVVLALSAAWDVADDHRTAKRMLLGVRDSKGLIERRGKSENAWRLTPEGLRVKAVLLDGI